MNQQTEKKTFWKESSLSKWNGCRSAPFSSHPSGFPVGSTKWPSWQQWRLCVCPQLYPVRTAPAPSLLGGPSFMSSNQCWAPGGLLCSRRTSQPPSRRLIVFASHHGRANSYGNKHWPVSWLAFPFSHAFHNSLIQHWMPFIPSWSPIHGKLCTIYFFNKYTL